MSDLNYKEFEYEGTTYNITPAHPAADKLPFIDKTFLDIVESMKVNGYDGLHPILLDEELDIIMAGRRRELAALVAGVKPQYTARKFKSEEDRCNFVIREELQRRHLTDSQIAMYSVELAEMAKAGRPHLDTKVKNASDISNMTGISTRTIGDAVLVKENAPELAQKVKDGEMSVKKAATITREKLKNDEEINSELVLNYDIPSNENYKIQPWMPNYEDSIEKAGILKESEAALQDALIALKVATTELRKIKAGNIIGTIIDHKRTVGDLDQCFRTIEEIAEMLLENIPSLPCPNCVGTGMFEDNTCKYCNGYGIFDQKHYDGMKYRWAETGPLYKELNNGK